jgi:hypothetical protein
MCSAWPHSESDTIDSSPTLGAHRSGAQQPVVRGQATKASTNADQVGRKCPEPSDPFGCCLPIMRMVRLSDNFLRSNG